MRSLLATILAIVFTTAAAAEELRGTGDLGVVVERADGKLLVVEHTGNTRLAEVAGLGDLSHASVVFSRDERYAYVFGRDGGLTKVDILKGSLSCFVNFLIRLYNRLKFFPQNRLQSI